MKKDIRRESGITLIALVITIIVLLVLSGVTLTLTFVDNGILSKTQIAKDENIKQEATEIMNLKITEIQLKSYGENKRLATLQYLADKLCEDDDMEYVIKKQTEEASLKKIDVSDVKSIYTKIKKYPYEFEINGELQLASIDGIKIATGTEDKEKIPEGYIKPSGTKLITENGEHDVTEYEKVNVNVPTYEKDSTLQITTKGDKIDVSGYQYVDTTGLYTKDQIQSGENIYWHKATVTFPTNGSTTMTTDLGYIPSFVYITATAKDGTRLMWYSENSCKMFYWCNFNTGIINTNGNSAWSVVDGKLKFTVGSASDWSGVNINIFAIK